MRKQTVAELRERAILKLLERNESATIEDATKTMNAFYRLCGMDERLLYLENDERTCNKSYTRELSDRSQKAVARVKGYFEKYNATLVYYGYLPTIVDMETNSDLYLRHFYE